MFSSCPQKRGHLAGFKRRTLDRPLVKTPGMAVERSQQDIVGAYTFIALAYCAATTWLFFTVGDNAAVAWIHLLSFVVIAGNYGVLRFTGRLDIATHVILTIGTLVVSSLFVTGGWQMTGYLWTFAYLPYAIFLASAAMARFWVAVLLLVDGVLILLDRTGAFGRADWLSIPYNTIQLAVFFTALGIFLLCMFLFQNAVLRSERTVARRAEESEQAKQRLMEAQRLARIGSWDWDLVNDRLEWSEEMYRVLRVSAETFSPSLEAYMDFVHPEDQDRLAATVERMQRDGGVFEMDHRIRGRDGAVRWIHAEGTVEKGPDGRPVRMRGTAQDITERKLSDARRLEIDTLQTMNRFKTEFMNSAAHELSTPLTPIKLEVHVLGKGQVPPEEIPKHIQVIDRNVQRLGRLVQDLLDGARFEAGHLGLDLEEIDLAAVVRDAVETHRPSAEQKHQTIDADVKEGLDVRADAGRIAQVLDNFLSNAIKYTPNDGHIQVTLRSARGGVEIAVEDDGRGFDVALSGRLFHPFSRIHEDQIPGPAGTGLGLYICRGLVEAHGGRIGAESAGPGKGSRFWFTLPKAADSARAAPSKPS